jgi:hypothetical protein
MVTSLKRKLRAFLRDERGEVGPVTYLFALVPALIMIFFAYDVGISKGARLGVEYAAFCAARAAAVQIPKGQEKTGGARLDGNELDEIKHAAAACLSSVAKKTYVFGRLDFPGVLGPLINRTKGKITELEIQNASGQRASSFGHNAVVQVKVTYRHDMYIPLSPLAWGNNRPIDISATAQAMLYTTK